MPDSRSILNFETAQESGYKDVGALVPVEVYLAAGTVDGEGKKSNRLVLRLKGTEQFFFLFPNGTEANMKKPAGWLQEKLERMAGRKKDEVPTDPVEDIPVGDPLMV